MTLLTTLLVAVVLVVSAQAEETLDHDETHRRLPDSLAPTASLDSSAPTTSSMPTFSNAPSPAPSISMAPTITAMPSSSFLPSSAPSGLPPFPCELFDPDDFERLLDGPSVLVDFLTAITLTPRSASAQTLLVPNFFPASSDDGNNNDSSDNSSDDGGGGGGGVGATVDPDDEEDAAGGPSPSSSPTAAANDTAAAMMMMQEENPVRVLDLVPFDAASGPKATLNATNLYAADFNVTGNIDNPIVLEYMGNTSFTYTPISGKVNGLAVFGAIFGLSTMATNETVFFYLDSSTAADKLAADVTAELNTTTSRRRRRRLAADPLPLRRALQKSDGCAADEVVDDVCVANAVATYREGKRRVRTVRRKTEKETTAAVTVLDISRYQDFARIAATCAAAFSPEPDPWSPPTLMKCLLDFQPSLQQRFLLRYTPLLNELILAETTATQELRVLKRNRNNRIDLCCISANSTNATDTNTTLRQRALEMANNDMEDDMDDDEEDDDEEFDMDVSAAVTPNDDHGMTNQEAAFLRLLQATGDTTATEEAMMDMDEADICQILQFDFELERSLLGIVEELFRTLTGESQPPPDRAYTVAGFQRSERTEQRITNKKESYALSVTRVRQVELDVQSIVRADNSPRKVQNFVDRFEFQATAVAGMTDDGTEFIGLMFTAAGRRKQLLWPVDFGNFVNVPDQREEEFTRRLAAAVTIQTPPSPRRTLPLDWSRRRRLQSEELLLTCEAPNIVDSVCVDQTQAVFQAGFELAQAEQRRVRQEVELALEQLELDRLEAISLAAAECGAEEGRFSPNAIFVCLRDRKYPDIARNFVIQRTVLENRLQVSQETFVGTVDALTIERDTELLDCCLEPVPFQVDPDINTAAPTATTMTPTACPTRSARKGGGGKGSKPGCNSGSAKGKKSSGNSKGKGSKSSSATMTQRVTNLVKRIPLIRQ